MFSFCRDQAPKNLFFVFRLKSINGIKLKSIQVAASYNEREDPRNTPKILVDDGTEGQQTTRLNLKMNLTNEKKMPKIYNA